ncbi:MAG TPA: Ig-like domain-containing protein, partial [Kofleriaceae bacterium]|nr:Ig-like domain-containing protein [Kofleriaceae bacterium]
MIRLHRASTFAALAGILAAACGGKGSSSSGQMGSASPLADQAYVQLKDAPEGLDLRVSDGKQGPPAYDRAKLAPAKQLGDPDVQTLLSRAAPITKDAADQQAFALRPGSQPAPRTGQTITAAFPPPASSLLPPAASDAGKELRVLRWMPEGPVPLAPELSVTFSQPMIAVTSQTDAAATVPVKLTPQPAGSWRWIGTRTILFDPKVRFPQATTYQVEIPAGTKSFAGTALAAATKFSFETPPPKLVSHFPYEGRPQYLDAPMFVLFDQRIDPAAVLAKIKVTADGKAQELRLLDPAGLDQLAKSPRSDRKQLAALVDAAKKNDQDGRWLAFQVAQDLPKDARISVEIPAGTPSAEGPNLTREAQRFEFRTYAPLRIERAECGYGGAECPPGTPFSIDFNNPLDTDQFDEGWITVGPEIPDLKVIQSGSRVAIVGSTKPRTAYKATISGQLVDEFGQTLGRDETRAWSVGDARPTFFGPRGMVVLDPAAKKRTLDFFSTNYEALKVRLYKVDPSHFDAYGVYQREQWRRDIQPTPPGALVFDQLVKTSGGKNQLVETSVDLALALDKSGLGHAIAVVEPHPWTEPYNPPRFISWVQATNLAVDAHVDATSLAAFATELSSGKPAGGVELELRPFGTRAQTDDRGMATLALGASGTTGTPGTHYLVARRGADVAFVAENAGGYSHGSWYRTERPTNLAWYVIDDRKMYRPGEEVALKGWLRTIDTAVNGDVGGPGTVSSVSYKVNDSRGNKIAEGTAPVSAVGGFDLKLALPKTPNLGTAHVMLEAQGRVGPGNLHHHTFQIEEFRRPEFEVSAQASQGPFLVGGGGDVTVSAKYYTGAPLPGADVTWLITASQTSFTPPNRDGYVFGAWRPWWGAPNRAPRVAARGKRRVVDDDGGGGSGAARSQWSHVAKTDGAGEHTVHFDFLSVKPALPMSVTATASVVDVNRQAWSASSALIVHPSQLYVGLKAKKPFVLKGTPFELDVIGVDTDGKAADGTKIEVRVVRLDWEYKHGEATTVEVDPQACAVTAAKDPRPCTFATKEGGTYEVTATIVDAKGRPNQTKMTFWVSGGERPPAREVEQEQVQIIPDRKDYAAGATAELLVQAPFFPAEGVVSWRRSGIVKMERISLDGPTKVISVPITDAMVPNLYVHVDLVGVTPRLDDKGAVDPKLPKRPAYAVGAIDLAVPPKQRTLAVEVAPSAPKVGPGESAELSVAVKDAAGRPVAGAEAAVIVVDEAILALTGYQFPSPIDVFYGHRGPDVRDHYLRAYVKLAKPDAAALGTATATTTVAPTRAAPMRRAKGGSSGPGGGGGGGGAPPPPMAKPADSPSPDASAAFGDGLMRLESEKSEKKADSAKDRNNNEGESGGQGPGQGAGKSIAIRSNFNPLAAFAPVVKTDAAGRATVSVKVPDNLTRYRIVAIAVAGEKQFGKGESALVARLPLMVRPSPPRFLNFGDTFRLPVVVQNQTDAPMTVRLAARTTNAALTDGAGREVLVPANDRVEVQFPAAAELAGTARFQIVGTAGKASDAAEVALPVWTPATTEAFA